MIYHKFGCSSSQLGELGSGNSSVLKASDSWSGLSPHRSGRRIFFSRVKFLTFIFSIRSTPMLLQQHTKDPGHSDKSACNGAEWSKDKTQAAESIKWRPQQAYGSNQFLLVQPQTVFSTPTKSSRSRIDKRTARATGNTRYRYSKIAPLDHKMADNCVSLARTNTLSSTITKPIKTWKTSNESYSYNLLNRINKMYTHDLFYLQQEWEAWLAPVYIQIRTTKSQLTQCAKYKRH